MSVTETRKEPEMSLTAGTKVIKDIAAGLGIKRSEIRQRQGIAYAATPEAFATIVANLSYFADRGVAVVVDHYRCGHVADVRMTVEDAVKEICHEYRFFACDDCRHAEAEESQSAIPADDQEGDMVDVYKVAVRYTESDAPFSVFIAADVDDVASMIRRQYGITADSVRECTDGAGNGRLTHINKWTRVARVFTWDTVTMSRKEIISGIQSKAFALTLRAGEAVFEGYVPEFRPFKIGDVEIAHAVKICKWDTRWENTSYGEFYRIHTSDMCPRCGRDGAQMLEWDRFDGYVQCACCKGYMIPEPVFVAAPALREAHAAHCHVCHVKGKNRCVIISEYEQMMREHMAAWQVPYLVRMYAPGGLRTAKEWDARSASVRANLRIHQGGEARVIDQTAWVKVL